MVAVLSTGRRPTRDAVARLSTFGEAPATAEIHADDVISDLCPAFGADLPSGGPPTIAVRAAAGVRP
jgi:hypothetical protein